jgi:hypothetical protein
MSEFDAALVGFAALDEEALARPWSWNGGKVDVRYALYRALEDAQESYVKLAAGPLPESRRILALAQRAFEDLRGLLLGLPGALLDQPPRADEWPLRETLRHMLFVERRYASQTRYAVDRTDADPVRIPDDRLPALAQIDVTGEIGAILARFAAERAETNRLLGDVAPAAMTRPTVWMHYAIDVRFRLHRFAAHVVEHMIQCEKTLASLGVHQTEGRRIARRVAATIGEIEGLGAVAEARALRARLVDRFASTRGDRS